MSITFDINAVDSFIVVLNALIGWRIEGDWTNNGFPADCFIIRADDNGLTVCDVDGEGNPQYNSTWLIGYDEINNITVL